MFPSILVVDDELSILKSLSGLLSDEGFEVKTAPNGYEALKIVSEEIPDLVMLDIWMPGMDGIETLKQIKKNCPNVQVIIITGHGTIETAIKATKLGAFDLIEKPLSIDRVIVAINNALNFRRLEEENKYLRKKTIEKHSITGESEPVASLKKKIMVAAPTDSWILITGENGTGKELVARTIHMLSRRADQPLIDVNCAAIPERLVDSELFGHEKEAVAGATSRKRGTFELANNGTIFFDEIADMSLKTQAKILRVLQERKFSRVGGSRMLDLDVRIIAASNKDLEKEIEKGNFREELYYRLNVIPIEVPPLRNRKEDIPLLVETFLDDCARQNRNRKKRMTEEALMLLCRYPWPGNVRELKNLIERQAIMIEKEIIDVSDIPPPYNPAAADLIEPREKEFFLIDKFKDAREIFEKVFFQKKLAQYHNNLKKTAEATGVSRSYLEKRLKSAR